nr:hypothetical protein REQ54_02548 [Rhizobium sp. Q54]
MGSLSIGQADRQKGRSTSSAACGSKVSMSSAIRFGCAESGLGITFGYQVANDTKMRSGTTG